MTAASALPFSAATLRRVSSATPLRAEAKRGPREIRTLARLEAGQMKISLVPKPGLYDFGPRSLCIAENYAATAVFNLNNHPPIPSFNRQFQETKTDKG